MTQARYTLDDHSAIGPKLTSFERMIGYAMDRVAVEMTKPVSERQGFELLEDGEFIAAFTTAGTITTADHPVFGGKELSKNAQALVKYLEMAIRDADKSANRPNSPGGIGE